MKYTLQGINAEELSFKLNHIRLNPDDKVDMKPQFARQVRRPNSDDAVRLVSLAIKIESSEEEPKPFNLHCDLVGVFRVEDIKNEDDERGFVLEATKVLYPYLRAAVANLTTSAFIMPVHLPAITAPIFPEDRPYFVMPGEVN